MDLHTLKSRGLIRKGLAPLNRPDSFPFGVSSRGIHELVEDSFGEYGALTGFLLATANSANHKSILWVSMARIAMDHGRLWQTGLKPGFSPMPCILFARPTRQKEALWCVEEGIHSGAVSLVIAELNDIDFKSTRRLALASEQRGVPVMMLISHTREGSTAANTRWRISSFASAPNQLDPRAPGAVRWQATLEKCRNAPDQVGQTFLMEMKDETFSLRLLSGLVSGQVAPVTPEREHIPTIARTG